MPPSKRYLTLLCALALNPFLPGPSAVWGQDTSLSSPQSVSVNPTSGWEVPDSIGSSRKPLLVPFVDFGGAVRDFGYDTWRVVSAPARLDRAGLLKLGAFVGVGGILFAFDREISEELRGGSPGAVHEGIRDMGDFFEPVALQSNTNAALAGVAVLGYLTRQDWLKDPAKQLLYSQWIGGLIRQASGRLVGRSRPFDTDDPYTFEPGEGKSFPSGHSAVAMEVATVLSHHIGYRPASVLLYAAAATVVFQRVDSGAHWASDAWFGAGLGLATARIVIETEESGRFSAQPVVGPGGGVGFGLSLRF